jgi:putative transposase
MLSKLSSEVARRMNTLSHYMFRMRLINKFNELNKIVEVKEEYYTSQTCTKCGNIKSDLGGAKVYKCEKCKMIMERDFNGARNIMLRNNF